MGAHHESCETVEEEDFEELDDDVQKFQIPIPGKPSAVFIIPKNLEQGDWEMLTAMLNAYIARLQKQQSAQ